MNATQTIPQEVQPWMRQVKTGYDAGYYKTEAAIGVQMEIPIPAYVGYTEHWCEDCGACFHSLYYEASLCRHCAPDYCTAMVGVGKE